MNETERVYYSYASPLPYKANILELRPAGDETRALLDKTIFYPEGGGQPADRGTINGVQVLDVREKDGEIIHLVSAQDAGRLKPGSAELLLDCRRRRDHTVLHTGQHLLSGTFLRMIGAATVSMRLGDDTCTIDVDSAGKPGFTQGEMSNETMIAVEEAVADAIEENHPVTVHPCPPEDISSFSLRKPPPMGDEVIRVVEIEGCDITACCGTHLKSTAEIGLFRIISAEKYKGMTRVTFLAGRRLLRDSRLLRQNAGIVSRALSVPVNETGRGVLEFLEKTAQSEKRLKALEETATRFRSDALLRKIPGAAGIVTESYADLGFNEILSIGKIAQEGTKAALILASKPDLKIAAFCSCREFDLCSFLKEKLEAHGGRGGGSSSFFQGSFRTKDAMDNFMRKTEEGI